MLAGGHALSGRRFAGAFAAVLTILILSGCGNPNEGTVFAAEFDAYLNSQKVVVAHESTGQQLLPYQGEVQTILTLDPSLDEAAVLEAATAIVSHRLETDISSHDVTICFSVDSPSPSRPVVSFYVQAASPLPDNRATRDRLASLADEAKAWVPADPGLTKVIVEADVATVQTTSEPLVVAPALADVLASGQRNVRTLEAVSPAGDSVVVKDAGDLAWLDELPSFVRQARAAVAGLTYQASASGVDPRRRDDATPELPDRPRLVFRLPQGTDDATVAAVEALPVPAGLDVTVFRPRPKQAATPTPTS